MLLPCYSKLEMKVFLFLCRCRWGTGKKASSSAAEPEPCTGRSEMMGGWVSCANSVVTWVELRTSHERLVCSGTLNSFQTLIDNVYLDVYFLLVSLIVAFYPNDSLSGLSELPRKPCTCQSFTLTTPFLEMFPSTFDRLHNLPSFMPF